MRFYYSTELMPCPYLTGRHERRLVAFLDAEDVDSQHDRLSRAGFRRSQNMAYRPVCPGCGACVSVRVRVRAFQPSRGFRKIMRRNVDLRAIERPLTATGEQYELFRRYLAHRHNDGEMSQMGWNEYRAMVEHNPTRAHIVEFRQNDDLVAVCLTDRLHSGLSGVYQFFAPEQTGRSLGTYAILWHIQRTRELNLPYFYLGYWIAESRKMAYKARFRPIEALTAEGWKLIGDSEREAEPAPMSATC
ncbi:MAG: arginyltransferase [Geminicoccaceae bacterium]